MLRFFLQDFTFATSDLGRFLQLRLPNPLLKLLVDTNSIKFSELSTTPISA